MIGPLASSERLMRVQRYMFKKHKIILKTKYSYQCRKSVADKRLRIYLRGSLLFQGLLAEKGIEVSLKKSW